VFVEEQPGTPEERGMERRKPDQEEAKAAGKDEGSRYLTLVDVKAILSFLLRGRGRRVLFLVGPVSLHAKRRKWTKRGGSE